MDLSDIDMEILHFTAQHAEALGIQKLYLLHVIPDFALPKQADTAFQKMFAPDIPVDERVSEKIQERLEEAFGKTTNISWEVEVREGKPYEKLLHWIEVKNIDLLIVGKKAVSEGSGITAKRVARNAGCAILFLPKGADPTAKRLIVPNDYSDNSARAIRTAMDLSHRMGGIPVHSLHVIDLPPEDYYNRSGTGQGYRGLLLESAQKAAKEFLRQEGLNHEDITEAFRENLRSDLARHIIEYARELKKGSFIVMGAKGHAPFETFLFGSVTEKLAQELEAYPLLIVR